MKKYFLYLFLVFGIFQQLYGQTQKVTLNNITLTDCNNTKYVFSSSSSTPGNATLTLPTGVTIKSIYGMPVFSQPNGLPDISDDDPIDLDLIVEQNGTELSRTTVAQIRQDDIDKWTTNGTIFSGSDLEGTEVSNVSYSVSTPLTIYYVLHYDAVGVLDTRDFTGSNSVLVSSSGAVQSCPPPPPPLPCSSYGGNFIYHDIFISSNKLYSSIGETQRQIRNQGDISTSGPSAFAFAADREILKSITSDAGSCCLVVFEALYSIEVLPNTFILPGSHVDITLACPKNRMGNFATAASNSPTPATKVNIRSSKLLIYPNPNNTGTLNVILPDDIFPSNSNITILDALGKEIYKLNNLNSNNLNVDISPLDSGFYILNYFNGTNTVNNKLTINR